MLRRILGFTIGVERLDHGVRAWQRAFGWVLRGEATVPEGVAAAWRAPAVAGRRVALLGAPTGDPAHVRLVETGEPPPPAVAGPLPRPTLGWSAVEIGADDPYALARELEAAHPAFRVVVPPRPIPYDRDIHAMQVLGPDREMLYLTRLPSDRTMLDLVAARCRVDRAFIAVLGVRSLQASLAFYRDVLGTPVIAGSGTLVQVINDAFGLGPEWRTPLGIVKLPREFLIEVDELPPQAAPRVAPTGGLLPGIAMVSFELDSPRDAGFRLGPDGEGLELLPPVVDPVATLLWRAG